MTERIQRFLRFLELGTDEDFQLQKGRKVED